jgi:hypothetical protein
MVTFGEAIGCPPPRLPSRPHCRKPATIVTTIRPLAGVNVVITTAWALISLTPCRADPPAVDHHQLEPIFTGQDLSGWTPPAGGFWRVENGVLVWLNDEQVSRYTSPKHSKAAPIGLQIHQGLRMQVEFRNLRALAL